MRLYAMHMLSMYIEPRPHVVLLKGQDSRYSCPVEGDARILGVWIREVLLYFETCNYDVLHTLDFITI